MDIIRHEFYININIFEPLVDQTSLSNSTKE